MSIIYGPVASWRLGRSLGIDMISTPLKTCSFNCVYCQLGDTKNGLAERKNFVSLADVRNELESLPSIQVDFATFSGVGEPTLAKNIGDAILLVKQILHIPIAVLTNSSMLCQPEVRDELACADVIVAKLDAPDDELFQLINRPVYNSSVHTLINGIESFRKIYRGKLAIQTMFIKANRGKAGLLAEVIKRLSPDEVQINTPLRPSPVMPLDRPELKKITKHFDDLNHVINVYDAIRPSVEFFNQQQTERRRPETKIYKYDSYNINI